MRKPYDTLISVLQTISAVLSLIMVGIVVVGVFYRYVLDDSLAWYDEFAGYTLVWLTMVGSVVALAKRKHIGFETLVERFPRRAQRAAEIFSVLCILGFALVLVFSGWQLIREMGAETAISLPWVKMAWVYSVMPVTGALMVVVCLVRLAQALSAGRARPAESSQQRPIAPAGGVPELKQPVASAEEGR